ncbi:hypothetical protein [Microvirga roseola]|nr:hypothetical protein [Microvirga roseola]
MFNKSRLPWSNDPLVLTLIAALIGASIVVYFVVAHGWSYW